MTTIDDVLRVLDLEATAGGFRGANISEAPTVFGGQLMAQIVVAASRSVPGFTVKSLHVVFARAAAGDTPVEFDVDVMHTGRSFGSVTVTAHQGERLCARALVLLHVPDPDIARLSAPMPTVPPPDELADRSQEPWWSVRWDAAIDISDPSAIGPATLDVWSRFPGAPADPTIGQALLAYASDGFLIATAMRPHDGLGQSLAHRTIATTVLDHTISFHQPVDASDWLLLAHESPTAGSGRSYGRATVFNTDGQIVASYVQDNMIRKQA